MALLSRKIMKGMRKIWSLLSLSLLIFVIVFCAWLVGDDLLLRTVTEALIRIVVVVGIYIFMGNSGVITFGSISFMCIGAYASAWQTCCPTMKPISMTGLPDILRLHTYPTLPAAIVSGALAAVVAFVIGVPIMRLSGIPASIGTLALLAIVHVTYANWRTVTLGTLSVVGLPLYVNVWVAFAWALVAMTGAYLYQSSRFGIALRASREDEVAAKAGGINVARQRLIAWVISAYFVGIGGVLYGHFVGVINVAAFYLETTFVTLAMLVVGGTRSLAGAVIGVVFLSTVAEILRQFEGGVTIGSLTITAPPGLQEVGLGLIMMLILILRPSGLTKGREIPWPLLSRKESDGSSMAVLSAPDAKMGGGEVGATPPRTLKG